MTRLLTATKHKPLMAVLLMHSNFQINNNNSKSRSTLDNSKTLQVTTQLNIEY